MTRLPLLKHSWSKTIRTLSLCAALAACSSSSPKANGDRDGGAGGSADAAAGSGGAGGAGTTGGGGAGGSVAVDAGAGGAPATSGSGGSPGPDAAADAPEDRRPAFDGPNQTTCGPPVDGMVCIPGGVFVMGRNGGPANEMPAHEVTVDAFQIDIKEATVAEYRACTVGGACAVGGMQGTLCDLDDPARTSYPINCMTWDDARDYCKARQKRLPREEEWEYAARRPDDRAYPWGNDPPTGATANLGLNVNPDSFPDLAPVGSFPADRTADGVLDMGGNVAEWTTSVTCPYTADACRSPRCGGCSTSIWAIRGGSFQSGVDAARATARTGAYAATQANSVGVRCVTGGGF